MTGCLVHVTFLTGLLASDIVAYVAVRDAERARTIVKVAVALTALSIGAWLLRIAAGGGCDV